MYEITMNEPGKNALGTELMSDLTARLRDADGRPVLLTGTDDAFSAGLNLKEVAAADTPTMQHFLEVLEEMVFTLYSYPGPTVAAVNGHAIAGGCVLALCCDHRVATTNPRTRIGLNEVAIGVAFPPITSKAVRQRIPRAFQERVMLEAKLHSPESALALGLVDELADGPLAVARTRLERLAGYPGPVYAATKADIRGDIRATEAETKAFVERVVPVWTSPKLKEALLAHLKR